MWVSNSWAEFAAVFLTTRPAYLAHEKAKTELKGLMPEDAKEAFGHGIRAKRSKSGAVSFEVLVGPIMHRSNRLPPSRRRQHDRADAKKNILKPHRKAAMGDPAGRQRGLCRHWGLTGVSSAVLYIRGLPCGTIFQAAGASALFTTMCGG
jgi:hypothetical protein